MEGNVGIFKNTSHLDNWALVNDEFNRVPDRAMQLRLPFPHPEVTTQTALVAYDLVLRDAGATLPLRDAVDRKVIRDIKEKEGGIVNRKENLLGWPPFRKGVALADSDNDGMPDKWEETYQLFSEQPDGDQDTDGDGYTNIEEYLNNTNPLSGQNDADLFPQSRTASATQPLSPYLKPILNQNYPNPFATTTQIKFTITQSTDVSLTILDASGREVNNLVEGLVYEGEYEFVWDALGLVPGVYVINLRTVEFNKSIKAVVSR